MITVLSLIGVAVLSVLLIVSLKRQLAARSEQKQADANRHSPAAQAQQEESRRRRADVRAAHKRRTQMAAPDRPTVNVGSDDDE
jgi:hypothetical protein